MTSHVVINDFDIAVTIEADLVISFRKLLLLQH